MYTNDVHLTASWLYYLESYVTTRPYRLGLHLQPAGKRIFITPWVYFIVTFASQFETLAQLTYQPLAILECSETSETERVSWTGHSLWASQCQQTKNLLTARYSTQHPHMYWCHTDWPCWANVQQNLAHVTWQPLPWFPCKNCKLFEQEMMLLLTSGLVSRAEGFNLRGNPLFIKKKFFTR